jgi:hypothetical protein
MTSFSDRDESTGNQGNRFEPEPHHCPSKFASIYAEQDSGGLLYSAVIDQGELNRIARLGEIPQHKIEVFEERLRCLLITWARSESEPRFTKRQLLNELSKLANLPKDAPVPMIPEWVWTEIGLTEIRRQEELEVGPLPSKTTSAEQSLDVGEKARLRMLERWNKSHLDPDELRSLASDVHAAVTAREEHTREYYATKRALAPERSQVAVNVYGFWTKVLGRPGKITKSMIAFADAVYRLSGIRMKPDAVKGQLVQARKLAKT